ncbi:MAG: DJ-1/PfpI family protein [Bacteroidales bacterium]|mgnify:CR=1 FL=1|nr:DJ-1/PfpI family protein [Bacteroidales bacterium]HOY40184.1 DJ-1/PfpI family protein [Bacteroidales bacterium]
MDLIQPLNVGIFLYDEVEVLDFAGPYEVFSTTMRNKENLFNVKTISENGNAIYARHGLKVLPDLSLQEANNLDILIIPGGCGVDEIENFNKEVFQWIKIQKRKLKILASVCTGAFLLAESGLLNGRKATTHWMDIQRLQNDYPQIEVLRHVRFVDEGDIITAAGISAGIDMSLFIVAKLFGYSIAANTAKRMEYAIDFKI